MAELATPDGYRSYLNLIDTQIAIKVTKDYFETNLARELKLTRVSAPLFVDPETGLNDGLSDHENAVSFNASETGRNLQVVSSLSKWARNALKEYGFSDDEGLYTDTRAIHPNVNIDNVHSIYVDLWDWEKIISKNDRTTSTLKYAVKKIFDVFKMTEKYVNSLFPQLEPRLPEEVCFLTAQELEDLYPDLTPKEREHAITKEKGAVFLMQIGDLLESGKKHNSRTPDCDDWELNGDLLFYDNLLDIPFEVSSMGIRVSEESLKRQLKAAKCEERASLPYHRDLLAGRLPYTMGGSIGQSRVCMFILQKAHIGEVQPSIWPEEMIEECRENGINLL